jgi:AsmA family/AsmA-like C-terminal region
MSIWKSPIFYLGIVLLMVVGAALVAPFVVNWDGYRDNLEAYGHKLTGREVAINGPISVRLFPWPRLVTEDVSMANPKGFSGTAFMNAKSITAELALAGLFGGEFRVESITVDHPVITISRNAEGMGNWVFEPDQVLRHSKLLDQVKLDQIKITDGVLNLLDTAHHFSNSLTSLNAVLAASAIEGPWRARGTANDGFVPLDFTFSSSTWVFDQPFRFGLRLAPSDGSLPAVAFDGQQNASELTGKVRVEPVVTPNDKMNLNGVKPLQMQADVKASFENVAFEKIHIVPADSKDSGTLIEGSANIALADGVKAQLNLNAPRLDLDDLAGAQSFRVWQAGGLMPMLNRVIKEFPQKFDLAATLDVAALSVAGQTIENVKLKAGAEQNAIRIQDFTANLPGRSRMKFDGIVFPGDTAAELGGSLAFESNDARQFVEWLWPEGKSQIAKYWSGNRGRYKSQSDVTWSGKQFGFQNLKYELDGEAGSGELAVRLGALPTIDLQVNVSRLDLDNYLPTQGYLGAEIISNLQSQNGLDKRLKLQAVKLRLNGIEAQDVAFDYASSLSGFEIKTFDIGSVEGAHIKGQGLVLQSPDGPSGDVKMTIKAENPRGFLQLVGITQKGANAAWTDVLGTTDIKATVSVKPGSHEPLLSYDVSGSTGPLHISASGDVKDLAKGWGANLGLSTEVTSNDSADLLRLFGLQPHGTSLAAGRLVMTAAGTSAEGFKTAIDAEILGGKFSYEGKMKPASPLLELDGTFFGVAQDGQNLARALGLQQDAALAGPLQIQIPVKTENGVLGFHNIAATVSDEKISGEASLTSAGELNADFALPSLSFKNILAASFMPWQGQVAKMDDAFASPFSYPPKGEIWLRPQTMNTDFSADLKETVLGIAFDQAGCSLSIASRGDDGEPFKLDFSVRPKAGRFTVSGSGRMTLDLDRMLHLANGKGIARGKVILDSVFSGEGRSPQAALSTLNGNGTYVLRDAGFTQVSPQNFFSKLPSIKDAGTLKQAFDSLLQPAGFALPAAQQNFSIVNGAVNFETLQAKSEHAAIVVQPSFDLASGNLVSDVTITPDAKDDLPALRVSYTGAPNALIQRSDTSAISAKLGYAMIAKDMAELDRVQKEQAKLVAEGEAQRRADEEKFAAYQAQRGELRLRQRELRVHAAQRVIDAEAKKVEMTKILNEAQGINKNEIAKFLRELKSRQPF